jgi:hypothetical protein
MPRCHVPMPSTSTRGNLGTCRKNHVRNQHRTKNKKIRLFFGRVFDRHAGEVGFADDLTIYAALQTALKVLVEMHQRLGEDAKLRYNMGKLKIYIPSVSRERAHELVLRHIDQDPSLESLRELYEMDLAKPELDIINVAGMTCVGVPMGTPEFVNTFVRSKAHDCARCSQASHRP